MDIPQICIIIFGASAIWLVSRRERWSRWGYIAGLLSQPFWFWTTIKHEQWGVLALAVWYTYSWMQGVYNYWIRKDNNE